MNYAANLFIKCINSNDIYKIIGYVSNKVYFYIV